MTGYARNVIFGTINGAGSWSMSFDVAFDGLSPALPTQAALDTYAEAVFAALKTNALTGTNSAGPVTSSATQFAGVRTYLTDLSTTSAIMQGASSGAATNAGSTPLHPPQIAMVVSKLTTTPGPHGRGRMYLPALGATIAGTAVASATDAGHVATGMANFLSAVNLLALGSIGVGYSCVRSTAAYGPSQAITRVRVDNVLDTMRPRRDKVVATARPTATVVVG